MPGSVPYTDELFRPPQQPLKRGHFVGEETGLEGRVAKVGFAPGLPDARANVFNHCCVVFKLLFVSLF